MEIRFKSCSSDGCSSNAHRDAQGKLGFCSLHYQRFKKHGDPTVVKVQQSPAMDWLRAHAKHSETECLRWPFHIGNDGYGRAHHPMTGGLSTASRLMCIFAHGEPPSNKHEAAHSCGKGNEACVNPNHLYWCTPVENQRERAVHGTSNRGEQQGNSKLTTPEVLRIRVLLENHSQTTVARMFGVDQSHISNIANRKQWAWLD